MGWEDDGSYSGVVVTGVGFGWSSVGVLLGPSDGVYSLVEEAYYAGVG